jgi:hypothetical protein
MHVGQCNQGTSVDLGQFFCSNWLLTYVLMVDVTTLHEQLLE